MKYKNIIWSLAIWTWIAMSIQVSAQTKTPESYDIINSWGQTSLLSHEYKDRVHEIIKNDTIWSLIESLDAKESTQADSLESIENYNKSVSLIWQNEADYIFEYFQIPRDNKNTFNSKIKEIQTSLWFKNKDIDGIVWDQTLKQIYLQYYSMTPEKLDYIRELRLDMYHDMLTYGGRKWVWLKALNVFKNMTFFGWWAAKWPIDWTFIESSLYGKVPKQIDDIRPKIILETLSWKHILRFYIDGKLYMATYISPGTTNKKTPRYNDRIWNRLPDKYHSSSSYAGAGWQAVMPFAVNISGPIWIHGSDGFIDGSGRSHGCIRTPLYYIQELFNKTTQYWYQNIIINTRWLY